MIEPTTTRSSCPSPSKSPQAIAGLDTGVSPAPMSVNEAAAGHATSRAAKVANADAIRERPGKRTSEGWQSWPAPMLRREPQRRAPETLRLPQQRARDGYALSMRTVLTIGHSNRLLGVFIELIEAHRVTRLV